MTVQLPLLIVGLILLWFPRQWMRLGRVFGGRRRRAGGAEPWRTREPGDPRLSFGEFAKGRNYFDLLRAMAGGLAIVGASFVAPAVAASSPASGKTVLFVRVAILVVGLLIQTIRYERRHVSFYAPIFYLAGLSVALCGPWPALFAFLLVWALNPIFGNAEAFLTVYGVVLLAFGYLFHDAPLLLAIAALGFCLVPVLLALLTRRPLVVFSRKPIHGTRDAT